ncbi:DUF771 domain-containing protein [Staphylococcus pseudintermedius]|uniref:DUF771 domain-containing protein n=1 Tax=Staphylococcus pseudintermedius TaxID=283734 RepID=UPI003F752CEB
MVQTLQVTVSIPDGFVRGRKWIKDNILNIPKFKKEIEEFSHYPINNNDEYIFVGSKMKKSRQSRKTRIQKSF